MEVAEQTDSVRLFQREGAQRVKCHCVHTGFDPRNRQRLISVNGLGVTWQTHSEGNR